MAKRNNRETDYVVLKLYEGPIGENGTPAAENGRIAFEVWEPMLVLRARATDEAIKKGGTALREKIEGVSEGYLEGVYKAVPLRSWKSTARLRNKHVTVPLFEGVETPQAAAEEETANAKS